MTVGLEAQFVLTTRNAENEQCYEQFDIVTVEIRNDYGREFATEAQVQDNKDGSYNISYFAKEAGTHQTSVMVNGEHVSGSPFTVQVKPRKYKPALSFQEYPTEPLDKIPALQAEFELAGKNKHWLISWLGNLNERLAS